MPAATAPTLPPSAVTNAITIPPQHRAWFKEASVYQIYPSSFLDSNDDGVGDLPGIISKVPYLKRLGIDIVWLSPIFRSPKVDMGYDVSDYRVIDPQYGSIEDVDKLAAALHANGMKLLLDLVVNHTSDQHAWFQESKKGKDSKYRDWYVWRKGKVDEAGNRLPPNNWTAHFGGSAWEYDESSDEYYLHLFCTEQPDLNWENPSVRAAVHEIIRFWLDRGIDGFRMDVINYISKDPAYPDSDLSNPGPFFAGAEFYAAGPRLHEYLQEIGAILKEYDAFSVGEMPCVRDPKEVIKSVRYDRGELNMIFHFELVDIDHGSGGKFSPRKWPLTQFKDIVNKWQVFMHSNGGWNALYLENHDQARSTSRYASDKTEHLRYSSKMLATFLGLQAGTVFIYQGQEIGMTNVPKEWGPEEYKDVDCLNHWHALLKTTNDPQRLAEARVEYQKKSRDNARTPMQWNSTAHGGFTSANAKPWMSANPNYRSINAESQIDDPDSPFNYWSSVLGVRKKLKDIVVYGDFTLLEREDENVLAYRRESEDGQKLLVLCNFSPDTVEWTGTLPNVKELILSNYGKTTQDFVPGKVSLAAYETCALLLA